MHLSLYTMKKRITLSWYCLSFLIFTSPILAQNALDFDGINDVVMIPNASAKIANSTNISLSCWVYSTSTTSGPHGIAGFRNNSDADFYLLQLTTTSMECRFNSSGITYDIVYNGYNINQWQHFVLTLDSDTLRLYHDGIQVATRYAPVGPITNTTTEMRLGNLPWTTSIFSVAGKVDEVSLWNKTLSPSEVSCIYNKGVNPFATDLQLYYDFNQGTAGGSNAGLTTLKDRTGNIDGTLTNFTLNGATSNWVSGVTGLATLLSQTICLGDTTYIGGQPFYDQGTHFYVTPAAGGCDSIVALNLTVTTPVVASTAHFCAGDSYNFHSRTLTAPGTYYDTLHLAAVCDTIYKLTLVQRPAYDKIIDETICLGETYMLGTIPFTEEGSYTESFQSVYGCDSIIHLNLDVDTINVGVSPNSGTLIASADQATNIFQWIDCNSGLALPNETNKFFNVPASNPPSAYAVVVTSTLTNCRDTSACFGRVVGIAEGTLTAHLTLTPNPVRESVRISLGNVYNHIYLRLMNNSGQVIRENQINQSNLVELDVKDLPAGIYFLQVNADEQMKVVKMLKH